MTENILMRAPRTESRAHCMLTMVYTTVVILYRTWSSVSCSFLGRLNVFSIQKGIGITLVNFHGLKGNIRSLKFHASVFVFGCGMWHSSRFPLWSWHNTRLYYYSSHELQIGILHFNLFMAALAGILSFCWVYGGLGWHGYKLNLICS